MNLLGVGSCTSGCNVELFGMSKCMLSCDVDVLRVLTLFVGVMWICVE
jgi:hypothetical protein